jgi:hypothetical protein
MLVFADATQALPGTVTGRSELRWLAGQAVRIPGRVRQAGA